MIKAYKKHWKKTFTQYGIADLVVYFCAFSILGHLLEYPYVMIGDYFFGVIPEDFGVWGYPFEPFFVYGVVVCFINIFIVPIWQFVSSKFNNIAASCINMYIIGVVIAIVFETGMGLIFNQPVDGVYPMWDNSKMPGNILSQGWIVNDLLYGLIIVFYVSLIYPLIQHKGLDKLTPRGKLINAAIVLGIFLINIYITYGIFHE